MRAIGADFLNLLVFQTCNLVLIKDVYEEAFCDLGGTLLLVPSPVQGPPDTAENVS